MTYEVMSSPLVLFVLGLMVGSFLNVCISRLPADESIVTPASRCPSCGAALRWRDNVPVISYLVLGGRCRSCREPISLRYPIVELITAAVFAAFGALVGPQPLLVPRLMLAALLVALFFTDLETQRLPNRLTYGGMAVALISSLFLPPGIGSSALGLAMGAGILLLIRALWLRATRVEAMGLGDVKMLAMIGAFLGWQQVGVVLFLASISGALGGIAITASGRGSMQSKLPFGTFLAAAALIAAAAGDRLLAWYLNLYR